MTIRVCGHTMAQSAAMSEKVGAARIFIEKAQRDALSDVLAYLKPEQDTAEFREAFLEELVRRARESGDDETILLTWVPITDEMRRLIDKYFWDNVHKGKPLPPPDLADMTDLYRSETFAPVSCPKQWT